FAPTPRARQTLLDARVDERRIFVTGNTGVDSLLWMLAQRPAAPEAARPYLLLTLHRRESFGEPLRGMLAAVAELLAAEPEAEVLWPVHPNPHVKSLAAETLGN